jgi:hypothetical protein
MKCDSMKHIRVLFGALSKNNEQNTQSRPFALARIPHFFCVDKILAIGNAPH